MRYVVTFAAGCALAALAAAVFVDRASAYLPGNCNEDHALTDYGSAEAIVIGRVVAVERVREEVRYANGRSEYHYSYFATVRVGRSIKGDLRVGDEFRTLAGQYCQEEEDDTAPTGRLMTCNTHAPHDLPPAAVRLFFINRRRDLQPGPERPGGPRVSLDERARELVEDGNIWVPRSCHFSIHEVVWGTDGRGGKTLWVKPGGRTFGEPPPHQIPLGDFIGRKREESRAAKPKPRGPGAPADE